MEASFWFWWVRSFRRSCLAFARAHGLLLRGVSERDRAQLLAVLHFFGFCNNFIGFHGFLGFRYVFVIVYGLFLVLWQEVLTLSRAC